MYLASESSIARPPKPMMSPLRSRSANMMRLLNMSRQGPCSGFVSSPECAVADLGTLFAARKCSSELEPLGA